MLYIEPVKKSDSGRLITVPTENVTVKIFIARWLDIFVHIS